MVIRCIRDSYMQLSAEVRGSVCNMRARGKDRMRLHSAMMISFRSPESQSLSAELLRTCTNAAMYSGSTGSRRAFVAS